VIFGSSQIYVQDRDCTARRVFCDLVEVLLLSPYLTASIVR
jgi:hypothetical protein